MFKNRRRLLSLFTVINLLVYQFAPLAAFVPIARAQEASAEPSPSVEPSPSPVVTTPTLSTDKLDYYPWETVAVTGTGLTPIHSYELTITSNDPPAVTHTALVTTDVAGEFISLYTLDGTYRPNYAVVLKDGETTIATTTFTDAFAVSVGIYDQCSNDDGDGYATGDTGCQWTNGNLQSNNSTYHEGDSTVQRVLLKDLKNGSHTVGFRYNTTKNGKHAYDYLTDDKFSETWITDTDMCDGTSSQNLASCAALAPTLSPIIPTDPNAAGHDIATPNRHFSIRNGTITGVSTPTISSGTYAGTSETDVTVSFTVDTSTCADGYQVQNTDVCAVLITFGAHISRGIDWGEGTTAVDIEGSPYHVALNGADGTQTGGKDNQMQASAIVVPQTGHLIVDKVTVPGDDLQSFNFDAGGGTYADFSLTDAAAPNDQELVAGTYSVAETLPAGWTQTSAACSDDSPINSINLAVGETVTCTFINTKKSHIIIVKDAISNNAQDFTFHNNFGNGNPATFLLDDDSNATLLDTRSFEVLPGTYTVSEDSVAGWQQESATCDAGETIGSIDVAPGETVTCTFVNEQLASIVLVKNTLGGNGSFDFDATGDGLPADIDLSTVAGTASQTFTGLDQDHAYSIAENVPAGWELAGSSCTGTNTPASITPDPGETVTCTFTNGLLPTLTLQKTVIVDDGGTATEDDFTPMIDDAAKAWDEIYALSPGIYTASETTLPEYEPSDWGTDCAVDGSVTLAYGDNKVCTITNDDIAPTLKLVKQVTIDNGGDAVSGDWTLFATGDGGFDDNGDSITFHSVKAGEGYVLSESSIDGYEQDGAWICDGGTLDGETLTLDLADDVTCTITNDDQAAHLIVIKHVINDNGGTNVAGDFTTTITGVETETPSAPGEESPGVDNVLTSIGSYSVTEGDHAGYEVTYSDDCESTIALGETKTCTVTNDDIAPILHLRKVVTNDDGGSATELDFTLTADGEGDNNLSGTSPVDSSNNLIADTFVLSETTMDGYTASDWECVGGTQDESSLTLDIGEEATCTITNDDIAPTLTIVKDAQPNDSQDFHFTGALGAFDLDDDEGVVDALGVNQPVSKTGGVLSGENTITETEPNDFWALQSVSCVDNHSNGAAFPSSLVGTTMTVNLPLAADVTCTFVNLKLGATRTQGFWQTHTAYTTSIFNAPPLGGNMLIGDGATHKGPVDTIGKIFGAYYSNIAKLSNGKTKRLPIDQARMILLQQLVTAKLNCAAFGCPSGVQTMITAADAAYVAGNQASILIHAGQLDTYNNSGDTIIISGNPGKATPKTSQGLANLGFWDAP